MKTSFPRTPRSLFAVLSLALAGVVLAMGFPPPQAADLIGAHFGHYYGPDDKAIFQPGFTWTFSATKIRIKAGKNPIPADLQNQLAPGVKSPQTIAAQWKLKDAELTIYNVRVDGQTNRTTWQVFVAQTAPGLFRIGDRQYVFTAKTN